jgi:tetratricopeptide (TPR) repeat protein
VSRACRDIQEMRFCLLPIAALLALAPPPVRAQAKVWEGALTLPTYEEGPPDPNPPFDQFADGRFNYPYTIRDNLTNRRASHNWRAVFLENEYLKCTVLPDLGGRLYTCIDKLSGLPMFYANPSIKKANIGYRGAWAAFGIEFNFPVSHNWVSLSPVYYRYGRRPDGSVSVSVGNIDRVYGMEWLVEIKLRRESTVVEEDVTLNNRSDVRRRFYWWNNAAIEVKDDSRIEFPMRFTAGHGFSDLDTWPVDSAGVDLSVIGNQKAGPVSRFAYGTREPFMGIWRTDTNTGTVHYAEFTELPAKKIWSWGVDADGLEWRHLLSDNDSAYVELQAGLFRNQETYAFLEPRQTIKFNEYWIPARGLGGIARANLTGVLNLSRRGGALLAAFNTNRKINLPTIRILQGKRVIKEEQVALTPEQTWTGEFPDVGPAPCTFELVNGSTVLLRHTEGQYDDTPAFEVRLGPQPRYHLPEPARRSADDWLHAGEDQELQGAVLAALESYHAGLKAFPGSFNLSVAAGRLAAGLQRYKEAIQDLEPAAARETWDPEIAYYLGLAYDATGKTHKARAEYEAAARMPSLRAAASLKLGELLARAGDRQDALAALRTAPGDLRAGEEMAALERAAGILGAAGSHSTEWLSRQPSSFLEWDSSDVRSPALMRYLAADPQRVLEIAGEYMRLGLYLEAANVLAAGYPAVPPDETEPGAVLPQQYPLVAYYRGYCREKLGQSGAADYALASKQSTLYVFPGRPESLEVLHAALRANPADATAHYLLGTELFSRGLTEEALAEWKTARRLNAGLPVLDADIGRALLWVKHEPGVALEAFRAGLAADGTNAALYEGIHQALSLLGKPASERIRALERYPDRANMPAALVYALALDKAEAGDFTGAQALLRNRFFPRAEGGMSSEDVQAEVQTLQALHHCPSGESAAHHARSEYLLGVAESRCGKRSAALQLWRRAAAAQGAPQLPWARAAAKKLPGYHDEEWRQRLAAALAQADSPYTSGMLEAALGRQAAARADFQQALGSPHRLLTHHLSRLALRGIAQPE